MSAVKKPEKVERMVVLTDLRELYLLIKRRILLITVITVLFASLAVVVAVALPSRYEASAVLMLDPRKTQVTNVEAVVSGLMPDVTAIRSEIDIIRSRAVVDRVLEHTDLMEDLERSGHAQSGMPWLVEVIGNAVALSKEFIQRTISSGPDVGEAAMMDERTRKAEFLLNNLTVSNDGRSYTIVIKYKATDPALAARVANTFADEYLADQVDAKYAATLRASEWLLSRLDQMRGEVQKAEEAIEAFKSENNLVGVGEETITQQQLVAINAQLVEARASRSQAEARLQSIEEILQSKGNLEAATSVLSSPLIQRLQEQEAEVRRREAELSTRYGDRHPTIINARAELRDIRSKISEEVKKIVQGLRNDVDVARARVESLDSELKQLEGRTGLGNQAMIRLRQLEREAAASRSLYEGFLNRSKQVAEQQDLQAADARIIARAESPLTPFFPNKKVFGAAGLFFGGMVSFLVIILLEYFDRGFRSVSEVERMSGIAGIGMVPALKGLKNGQKQVGYVLQKPLSAYAEALRTIRTAIHFSNAEDSPKVLMITSSVPSEGKTVFSISLARVLAKAGNKILLIDADLRRPRVENLLNLDLSKPDLAQVLAGEATAAAAIQKDESGADVLMAQNKSLDPQSLLGSKQMENLIKAMRSKYDLVIIDTPPIMAVSDVAMLAGLVDTSLYVVRWASTPREVVMQGLRQVANFKIKLAGVVMTQVDLDAQTTYGYGDYGYYYGRYKDYYTN